MILIGNIKNFKDMFIKSDALNVLYDYLLDASNVNGNIYKRILSLDCESSLDSRVEIKYDLGFGMNAIEQSYKLGAEIKFESHREFIDFQLLVFGEECMEVGYSSHFEIINDYDLSKDVILYTKLNDTSTILLYPANLLVLFPYDIHAGGIVPHKQNSLNQYKIVFKSVIKVPISLVKFRF